MVFMASVATSSSSSKRALKVLLVAPRGFCAGVERAVDCVELAIQKYGSPVYVRHEIVHNKHVVKRLENMGAVFVESVDQVPDGVPLLFSAHGVSASVVEKTRQRGLTFIDATCPLVTKVHTEVRRYVMEGYQVIMVGHAHHPEVIGTMGQVSRGRVQLVENAHQARSFVVKDDSKLAYVTQTTLSVDDTADIISILCQRFPHIKGPSKSDICYATSNRQQAVKDLAPRCQDFWIIGAANSSNTMRLIDVAKTAGCPLARLVCDGEHSANIALEEDVHCLGLTASASAPEVLVQEVLASLALRFSLEVEEVVMRRESVRFSLPKALRSVDK